MPAIGEITKAVDIRQKGYHKLIWQACANCGKERWVQLRKGRPVSTTCSRCSCGVSYRASSESDKEKARVRQHTRQQKLKTEVLSHYSKGKLECAICAEKRMDCLSLDHMNNNGEEDRKRIGEGVNIYRWLRKQAYPSGFQVLCMNCQFIKRAENQRRKRGFL